MQGPGCAGYVGKGMQTKIPMLKSIALTITGNTETGKNNNKNANKH